MKIQRINAYDDLRFRAEVLKQHGAFLVDRRYPCEILITGRDRAVAYYHDYGSIGPVIREFRFYAEHITFFTTRKRSPTTAMRSSGMGSAMPFFAEKGS